MAGKVVVSTLNDDTGVLAARNGMTGICKAWVNFNGTGTVAIRDSFNVSSITDNGTGDYTVNFTTAMPNANYATVGLAQYLNLTGQTILEGPNNPTTTSVRVLTKSNANSLFDSLYVSVAIFSS